MNRINTHEFLEVVHLYEQGVKLDEANLMSVLNQTPLFGI